jgi:hypothetical protein
MSTTIAALAPPGTPLPDRDRVSGAVYATADWALEVSVRAIAGDINLSADGIASPTDAIATAAFGLAFNETLGQWTRDRAFELTEAAGFPAYQLSTAALPYLLDPLANGGSGDFYISRGALGVAAVRTASPRHQLRQAALIADGAMAFRNKLEPGDFISSAPIQIGMFMPSSGQDMMGAGPAWFQIWDLDDAADVPTMGGVALPKVSVFVRHDGSACWAVPMPEGGIVCTTGIRDRGLRGEPLLGRPQRRGRSRQVHFQPRILL